LNGVGGGKLSIDSLRSPIAALPQLDQTKAINTDNQFDGANNNTARKRESGHMGN
jgi:hypothetical protein